MKIIILGAGQVGSTLAENLVMEGHDVVVVDKNVKKLKKMQEQMDIAIIHGSASYPNVLRNAGADNADLLIAVTENDEINMLACQIAHFMFQVPSKVARIRTPEYYMVKDLFTKENMHIDQFIYPEKLLTQELIELIKHPGTLQVLNFADGQVKLVGLKAKRESQIPYNTISELKKRCPQHDFRVAAIFRNNQSILPDGDTIIQPYDEIFIVAASKDIVPILKTLKQFEEPYKNIIIAGGHSIGFHLAYALENKINIKVIDDNDKRCKRLAEQLKSSTVLLGEATDRDLLINENIENFDVFCALTPDDENNIMSCIQAKQLGVRQTIALLSKTEYVYMLESSRDLNIPLSPKQASISSILTYLRSGDIPTIHSLRHGAAEAMEIIVSGDENNSRVAGHKIRDIKAPHSVTLGAIIRDNQVIIPKGDTVIQNGDHVIIFVADKKDIKATEKLFKSPSGLLSHVF